MYSDTAICTSCRRDSCKRQEVERKVELSDITTLF